MLTLRNSKDYTEKNYIMSIEKVKSKYYDYVIFNINNRSKCHIIV